MQAKPHTRRRWPSATQKFDPEGRELPNIKYFRAKSGVGGGVLLPQKQVKDALQLPDEDVVRQDKERGETSTKSWASKMTKQEQPEWLETTQRRVRDACVIVAQGQLKSRNVPWVKDLPWLAAPEHGKDDVQEGQEREAEQDGKDLGEEEAPKVQQGVVARGHGQVEYGFLPELLLPYRVKADSGKREPGLSIVPLVGAGDEEVVIGEWLDVEKHSIKDCTHGRLKVLNSRRAVAAACSRPRPRGRSTR